MFRVREINLIRLSICDDYDDMIVANQPECTHRQAAAAAVDAGEMQRTYQNKMINDGGCCDYIIGRHTIDLIQKN